MTEKARLTGAAVEENVRHAKKLGWSAVVMGGIAGFALLESESALRVQFAAPLMAAVFFRWRFSDRRASAERIAENGHDTIPSTSTETPDNEDVQFIERYVHMVQSSKESLVRGDVVTDARLPASKIRIKTALSEAIRQSQTEAEQDHLRTGYLSLCAFQPIPQGFEDLAASVARAEALQLADELAMQKKYMTGSSR